MSANIDMTNGRANFAFTGNRNDIWHRLGTEMQEGMSIDDWAKAAGLDWDVLRTPAFHQLPDGTFQRIDGWSYTTRNDTLAPLGYVSDSTYKHVVPAELLDFINRYVSVDERFKINTAGSLDGGRKFWVNAIFNGPIEVGGSEHKAYLLASTSLDGTQATVGRGTMVRVVCENTLHAAVGGRFAGKGEGPPSEIRLFHSAKFDPAVVSKQLSAIVRGFDQFKAMGDAMALVEFSATETSLLFKKLLDIDPNAKAEDVSTRKMNQFLAMSEAYTATKREGTEGGTVWTALNAVTRYVDHDRSSRNGDSQESARFDSALFGSGAALKAQAVGLLMPLIRDKIAA